MNPRKGNPSKGYRSRRKSAQVSQSRPYSDDSSDMSDEEYEGTYIESVHSDICVELPSSACFLRSSYRSARVIRSKGKSHERLKNLTFSNPRYNSLISYRTYLLKKSTHKRTGKETSTDRDQIKRLEISMKDHLFSGEYPYKFSRFWKS